MATCKWALRKKKDGTHVISIKRKHNEQDSTYWYNFEVTHTPGEKLATIVEALNTLAKRDPLGFTLDVGQGGAWHINWQNHCVAWNGYNFFKKGTVFKCYLRLNDDDP